jgi:hypothetical protein
MIPLVQASSDAETLRYHADDLDALLEGDPSSWASRCREIHHASSRAATLGRT